MHTQWLAILWKFNSYRMHEQKTKLSSWNRFHLQFHALCLTVVWMNFSLRIAPPHIGFLTYNRGSSDVKLQLSLWLPHPELVSRYIWTLSNTQVSKTDVKLNKIFIFDRKFSWVEPYMSINLLAFDVKWKLQQLMYEGNIVSSSYT